MQRYDFLGRYENSSYTYAILYHPCPSPLYDRPFPHPSHQSLDLPPLL